MPDFPIVPSKTALLFFDTLNIYLNPDDPQAKAEVEKSGVVPRMQKINEAVRKHGIAVFYAAADHRPDHKDFKPLVVDYGHEAESGAKGRLTPPPPVAVPGPAREVIAQIAPQPQDYVIKKHRWSTFFETHFELSLRTAGIDTIMMCGGSVEVGIASTAYSARDRDFNQIILRDACTSRKPDVQECFMNRIFPVFCRVMTVDEAIALIK